jgi:hypothetical protein
MPTKGEVHKEIKKTEALLHKLKMQMMNPGLPMHLAPKGKKSKPRSRSRSRPKSKSRKKQRSKSRSKSRSRPRSKSKSRSRSKSKSKLKQRSRPGIQSKKKKMENLGVDPRLLFGLDSDELDALLENPQLIKSMAPYSESFRPPDDDPPVSPLGLYDYPFGDNPYHPSTLKRNTAQARPQPEIYMHPRFG